MVEVVGLAGQDVENLLVGDDEGGDAFLLEAPGDPVEVDAHGRQLVEHLFGVGRASVHGPGDGAVVLDRGEGGQWQGGDRVGTDQLVDVAGVGVGGVLGGGRGPQRTLQPAPWAARVSQRGPLKRRRNSR